MGVVGEMGELVMRAVAQSRFTPLPEALCVAVAELCQARPPVAVTMAAISDSVRRRHGDVTAPAECVVYAMLGHLVREGKLYCTGQWSLSNSSFICKSTSGQKNENVFRWYRMTCPCDRSIVLCIANFTL